MTQCEWAGPEQIYIDYHNTEWGVPEYDSRALWEKLILDGFQAGLSWITILKKRDAFREAFEGFDPHVIATWGRQTCSACWATRASSATVAKSRRPSPMRKRGYEWKIRADLTPSCGIMLAAPLAEPL